MGPFILQGSVNKSSFSFILKDLKLLIYFEKKAKRKEIRAKTETKSRNRLAQDFGQSILKMKGVLREPCTNSLESIMPLPSSSRVCMTSLMSIDIWVESIVTSLMSKSVENMCESSSVSIEPEQS